jgi:hypothetical protein
MAACQEHRLGNDRTKVQRGERTFSLYLIKISPTKQETTKRP